MVGSSGCHLIFKSIDTNERSNDNFCHSERSEESLI